ncbi:MAG: menaquinone-dependent protoporphyrinogen oxidase [Pseudonocardiales bacterium]|nr:menaquinone-dependent protoporphyrinogen oxidase [Pseudonocardiales bacterium]
MKVLITVASKHGSTFGIAEAIGSELATCGLEVSVAPVQDVRTIDEYDAVVLGSAIHMGQWMKPAKDFVARESATLTSIPVWLFSSGPVTDRSKPDDPADRRQGDQIAITLAAREHRVFRGKLDKRGLSFAERAIVRIAKAPSEGSTRLGSDPDLGRWNRCGDARLAAARWAGCGMNQIHPHRHDSAQHAA